MPDTAKALVQFSSEMNSVQKQLVNVLREVAQPDVGVAARIRNASDSLLRNMAARAQQMDDYLVRLEKQVWAVWLPVVASAAFGAGICIGHVVCKRKKNSMQNYKRSYVATDADDCGS